MVLQMYTLPSSLVLAAVSLCLCSLFWLWFSKLCQQPTPPAPKMLSVTQNLSSPLGRPRCYSYNHCHTAKEFNCFIKHYVQINLSPPTFAHTLTMSVLYSEKSLLSIHVSRIDNLSTDLPTRTIKHSSSTHPLFFLACTVSFRANSKYELMLLFVITFSPAWKFITCSRWFDEGQMHMGCFSFITAFHSH